MLFYSELHSERSSSFQGLGPPLAWMESISSHYFILFISLSSKAFQFPKGIGDCLQLTEKKKKPPTSMWGWRVASVPPFQHLQPLSHSRLTANTSEQISHVHHSNQVHPVLCCQFFLKHTVILSPSCIFISSTEIVSCLKIQTAHIYISCVAVILRFDGELI